jgi:N-glycosylase/DNA lyase
MAEIELAVEDFNLDHIFDCGQCFRWRKLRDGSYTGISKGYAVNMNFTPFETPFNGSLCISELAYPPSYEDRYKTEEERTRVMIKRWETYLDLDRDYGKIKEKLSSADPVMAEAIKSGEGIRILRQDLWETILSFLISQNNNIKRIQGCLEKIASLFGMPLVASSDLGDVTDIKELAKWPEGLEPFALPEADKLAALSCEDLEEVHLGYRDKYLIAAARAITESGLPETYEDLLGLFGIGPKVANCISLFGMEKRDSFPIDVWIRRIMSRSYGFDEKDLKGMASFAEEHYGPFSGFAQQYLFYHARNGA